MSAHPLSEAWHGLTPNFYTNQPKLHTNSCTRSTVAQQSINISKVGADLHSWHAQSRKAWKIELSPPHGIPTSEFIKTPRSLSFTFEIFYCFATLTTPTPPSIMGPSIHLGPNATGTGNIGSFNTTGSYNTISNITYGDERAKLLNWLSPLQPRVRHNDARGRRQDGIGEWFLQTDEFLRWRDGEGEFGKGTLFCSGNPGVGKTFLR